MQVDQTFRFNSMNLFQEKMPGSQALDGQTNSNVHSQACASMSEIVMERASNILEMAEREKRKVWVLWSGGIDTTTIVVAFCALAEKNRSLRDMITICHSVRSQAEYPQFYKDTVLNFDTMIISHHVRDILSHNAEDGPILVTGDPADVIFGSHVMSQCLLDPPTLKRGGPFSPLFAKLEASWTIFADFMVYKGLLSEAAKTPWIQWIQPFVDKSPIPVVTVFDFLWWCSYGFKYQHDLNRIFYNNTHETIPEEMVNQVFNFYDTMAFSQWSYHFHQSKMRSKKVWASYKHALKDFIRGYTKDQEYYAAKLNVQSVSNSWGFEHGMDNNYNLLR